MSNEEDECESDGIDSDVCVIIDNGSGMCKAGLSTSEVPLSVFPEVIGKPRKVWKQQMSKKLYCGAEVEKHRSKLTILYPIENGIIEDFEQMEVLWEYTFVEQLRVNPTDHPLLLTEPPYNPKPTREKMVEIMFETFGVPTLNISIQGVLALLGQGRTTGLVLDVGEGVAHTIPVFEGFGMTHHINRLDMAGRELNVLLAKLLSIEGTSMTTTQDQHEVRMMKEKHCYVALDPACEFADTVEYTLPDGRVISLGDERWKCTEALFNPILAGHADALGVSGMVWDSISKCEVDTRRDLLGSIVLSGGSTMFHGFRERLLKELKNYAPAAAQANIRVIESKDQKNAVFVGAQLFSGLRSMQEELWMSVEEYDEYGVHFIHDKTQVKYN